LSEGLGSTILGKYLAADGGVPFQLSSDGHGLYSSLTRDLAYVAQSSGHSDVMSHVSKTETRHIEFVQIRARAWSEHFGSNENLLEDMNQKFSTLIVQRNEQEREETSQAEEIRSGSQGRLKEFCDRSDIKFCTIDDSQSLSTLERKTPIFITGSIVDVSPEEEQRHLQELAQFIQNLLSACDHTIPLGFEFAGTFLWIASLRSQ
jgi:hypothetical protein